MKAALGFACRTPLHREHLRTASLIMVIQCLITVPWSDMVKGLILTASLFAWDLLFIFTDITIARGGDTNE